MTDPFDALALPTGAQRPRPSFARALRARLMAELELSDETHPTIDLPGRAPMTTTATPTTTATAVTPYLTASDAAAALDWYAEAFGAVEQYRIVGDDGRIGHAELRIGDAILYLSDEHPDLGVVAPTTLGGTATALHLQVTDVDRLYARAVAAGATAQQEPADQAHGARHGTLVDPFGHRWMLSQHIEDVDDATMDQRLQGSGYRVEAGASGAERPNRSDGSIWAAVFYRDALAGIRFLVDVLGFEEQLVVTAPDDPGRVVHSQIRWPEGGVLQAGTFEPDNPFSQEPGTGGVYVITADPMAVWARCQAAGAEVVRAPEEPDYDEGGTGFAVRDPEGNTFSFGTYAG